MLDKNKDLSISGGTFSDNRIDRSTHTTYIGAKGGFDLLKEQVAPRAFFNSGERSDAPKCHPRTRIAVLERIMEWIWGREDRDALIMWLYGPAGAGKSAIAQSIAEKCDEIGLLLATFFFSKSDGSRNSSQPLIPTIAYQVALHLPETWERISAAILHDPLVFTKSLQTQVELLLIKPLRPLMNAGYFTDPNSRRLIIIDGLDECHDPKVQQKIIEQISNMLRARNVPVVFLIASRPETHLSVTFDLPAQTTILARLALGDQYQPDQDIRVYLEDSFKHIRSTHPRKNFIPKSWPSPDQVDTLVSKASGQFIYAAIVMKYIESLRHSPVDRLAVILGLHPPHNDRPFAELDALYTEIFLALDEPGPVLQIIGLITASLPVQSLLSAFLESNIDAIATFLCLKPSDICGCMTNISALVTLKEFLDDPFRAGTFYLDPGRSHAQVVHRYLQFIHDENEFNVACASWGLLEAIAPAGLLEHCRSASMTEELREDLVHLSVPKFIDFFLSRPEFGGLNHACEVLELLSNMFQGHLDIPDYRPGLRKHLLNLLEPYFSHPRLTSLCILAVDPWSMSSSRTTTLRGPRLGELLQLDESLREIDQTRFWFVWDDLELARLIGQHIKSTIPSTVTERKGKILATLALHLLEYLCDKRFPQIIRLRKPDYGSRLIRDTPWTWRHRFMAIKRSRSKLDKDYAGAGVPIEWCFNSRVRLRYYQPDIHQHGQSLFNFIYALDRLPTLLKHAAENEDLITFASRHTIFPKQAFHFHRLKKRAQNAVNAYLARFPPHHPAIPASEHFGEGPDGRCGHRPGSPWDTIFLLFPHLLAFVVYIFFFWVTFFA